MTSNKAYNPIGTHPSKKSSTLSRIAFFSVAIAVLAISIFLFIDSVEEKSDAASIVILNTKVWTADDSQPWAEAIAVKDEKILFVGSSNEARKLIGSSTKVYDGKKHNMGLVTPGFIDCHMHIINGGFSLTSVDLRDAMSREEFVTRIKLFAEKLQPGRWIREGNWNHENWGGLLPDHTWIDEVTSNNPVWLCRLDGHMCLANKIAMNIASITASTPNVEGGEIVRDSKGNPTGIFKDNAMFLIENVISPPTEEEEDQALEAAMNYLAANGVTSIHHMGRWDHINIFERARENNKLKTRIYSAVPLPTWDKLKERIDYIGRGDDWFKIGNLKAFTDGSLGSHTALMYDPYIDVNNESRDQQHDHHHHAISNNNTGLYVTSPIDMLPWVRDADKAGLQLSIHAIGDRAIDEILTLYETVIRENGIKDRRFRIEHAQHIREQDRARFAKNNIIASMQPFHLIDDGVWVEKFIRSDKLSDMYVLKTLYDNGTIVALGSDWFVAPPISLWGIYAAVTRSTLDGKNPDGWFPNQKISVEQALLGYTRNAAYASFDEHIKGILKKDYLADFTIINQDITQLADPHQIWDAKIQFTVVGGNIVFNTLS